MPPAIQPPSADRFRPAAAINWAGFLISWGDLRPALAAVRRRRSVRRRHGARFDRAAEERWEDRRFVMTLLDIILIGVMLVSALLAMIRGFMREILLQQRHHRGRGCHRRHVPRHASDRIDHHGAVLRYGPR